MTSNPYRDLVEAWLREISSDELVEIQPDLFERVEEWLRKLEEDAQDEKALEVVRRLSAVCKAVMAQLRRLREVKRIYEGYSAAQGLVEARKHAPDALEPKVEIQRPPTPPRVPEGSVLVTFKTPLREFVASDLRVYGPFREGDVCLLPEEDAAALEARGIVEVFREDEDTEQD